MQPVVPELVERLSSGSGMAPAALSRRCCDYPSDFGKAWSQKALFAHRVKGEPKWISTRMRASHGVIRCAEHG